MIRQTPVNKWYCQTRNWFGEVPEPTVSYLIRGSGKVGNGLFVSVHDGIPTGPFKTHEEALTMSIYNSHNGGVATVAKCVLQGDGVWIYRSLVGIDHKGELETLVERMVEADRFLVECGMEKAVDPNNPDGLEVYVLRLEGDWEETFGPVGDEYVDHYTDFIESMGWVSDSEVEVRQSFEQAGFWFPPTAREAIPQAGVESFNRSMEIGNDVKSQLITGGLQITPTLSLQDTGTIRVLNQNSTSLMPQSFAKQSRDVAQRMYAAVVAGVEQGLSLDQIVDDIVKELPGEVDKRQKRWTKVAAHSVIGRARSYSQLASYLEAGITEMLYDAVIDEVTTPTCMFLHGKVIETQAAYTYHKQVIEGGEDMVESFPWVQVRSNKAEGTRLYVNKGGVPVPIASASPGGEMTWAEGMNMKTATGIGIHPPSHARCRSTTRVRIR